jgi:hypothetical protein
MADPSLVASQGVNVASKAIFRAIPTRSNPTACPSSDLWIKEASGILTLAKYQGVAKSLLWGNYDASCGYGGRPILADMTHSPEDGYSPKTKPASRYLQAELITPSTAHSQDPGDLFRSHHGGISRRPNFIYRYRHPSNKNPVIHRLKSG